MAQPNNEIAEPLNPDDPTPDLEQRLTVLETLGATEFDVAEREVIMQALKALDAQSRQDIKEALDRSSSN